MIGRPCENGRYGGGSGGSEDRYHFPALDDARFDEAKHGKWVTTSLQGESGQAIGAFVNTFGTPRGQIMGATHNCCWPTNGFKS